MTRVELRVGEGEAGMRLDAALAASGAIASRAEAQKAIESGGVAVDGEARSKGYRLNEGELITVETPEAGPQLETDVALEILHEDDHLLVVDKPAGLVVHPARGRVEGSLAQVLAGVAAGGPDSSRPGIVHRLDRDTSGLLVVARSEPVHRALQAAMRRREIRREYVALVEGRPPSESGTIDAPLGRDRSRRTIVSTRTDRPREARTHFWTIEALRRTTLLGLRLETGRTHQIRAHLAAIRHPVCGDRDYGGGACGQRLGLSRQFLHSRALTFRHPVTGEVVACESKPPVDLHRALDVARREPVSGGPDGG
jgi:23S rRNA pseudouridine1911/1915/1917 synthase